MTITSTVAFLLPFAIGMGNEAYGQSSVPLSVVSVQTDRAKSEVVFAVRNDSAKPITAWQVALTYPDDSIKGNVAEGVDGYWANHLAPGAIVSHSFHVRLQTPSTPITVDIQPTAVVFADTSAIGDAAFVEYIFAQRARERRAWEEILVALEAASADGSRGPEQLQVARARLAAPVDGPDHPRTQIIRAELDRAIQDARLGRVNATVRLTELIEEARERIAAAKAHTPR